MSDFTTRKSLNLKTRINNKLVSTVSVETGYELVHWETIVFDVPAIKTDFFYEEHYRSEEEAKMGHIKMCQRVLQDQEDVRYES